MSAKRQPVYLARRGYRRRRLVDAARLLPVLGTFLVLLPIMLAPPEAPEEGLGRAFIFLFSVWFGLIAAAWLLARLLAPEIAQDNEDEDED